jgi:hypothetical protein
MLNTVGIVMYIKYWEILYVEHCGKIYLHKILRNIVCWALWEDYLHKILGITLCWTLGRFIYTKYWGILYVEHCGEIYLHKILRNNLCWTLRRFIYTKYWGILLVEHCGNIYLHTILRNIICSALWEDLFTQNTEEYFMFNTVKYLMLCTVGRFIYTTYWGILCVEHHGKIYLHKILRNIVCWALWEDLFTGTQNTEEYFMLSTVGRFICIKYWRILYVEHCEKTYLHKILRNTVCWALWEDLLTQNTGDYFLLNTVGIVMYIKYWEILYVEQCGKNYLHKILRKTVCWTLKIYLHKILRNNVCLSTVGRFIYTKYWGILYVKHW